MTHQCLGAIWLIDNLRCLDLNMHIHTDNDVSAPWARWVYRKCGWWSTWSTRRQRGRQTLNVGNFGSCTSFGRFLTNWMSFETHGILVTRSPAFPRTHTSRASLNALPAFITGLHDRHCTVQEPHVPEAHDALYCIQ